MKDKQSNHIEIFSTKERLFFWYKSSVIFNNFSSKFIFFTCGLTCPKQHVATTCCWWRSKSEGWSTLVFRRGLLTVSTSRVVSANSPLTNLASSINRWTIYSANKFGVKWFVSSTIFFARAPTEFFQKIRKLWRSLTAVKRKNVLKKCQLMIRYSQTHKKKKKTYQLWVLKLKTLSLPEFSYFS